MSASGYTPISLYYSTSASAVPVNTNLANGELAINITDGKLFYKDNAGVVQTLASKSFLTTINFGTTGLTPATASSGAITVAGTLVAANGGTGYASYAVGDLLYADTTTTFAKLADVATGNALISGGVTTAPAWGKIGLTTHVSGTLGGTNGGTGVNNGANTITIGGNVTMSGAYTFTGNLSANTSVTFPTTGTLVNSAVTTLSSLVSVGTITTGTWNATIIGATYGGTGVNNGSNTITLGGNVSTAGAFTTSGAFGLTLTTTALTSVTLPTSGTLVNTAVTTLSSLASIGTITTGTWNGSVIGAAYGGTGVANNAASTLTITGNFATTFTVSGTTGVTLPTTGTLATLAGSETLTNKTLTNPTVTSYVESVVVIGTVTTTNTLSLTNGTVQTATLTASTGCTFTMPTATAGKSFVILLKQAASTGNGTATFTGVKWGTAGAPTITATAGKMDILSFIADGTNWYGSIAQGYTP
jgi:hypothetical protein